MPTHRTRYYPLEPALRYLGTVWTVSRAKRDVADTLPDLLLQRDDGAGRALAELAGYSARAVHHWREHGISEPVADRIAISLGAHPATIWPEWFDIEVPA